jgi:putative phosphoribosyl transferase
MGLTMEAAIQAARQEKPSQLILALPVGPTETIDRLSQLADATVCLCASDYFRAVSQFYFNFPPVHDREIMELLKKESARRIYRHDQKHQAV